jgi:hypothetical protein
MHRATIIVVAFERDRPLLASANPLTNNQQLFPKSIILLFLLYFGCAFFFLVGCCAARTGSLLSAASDGSSHEQGSSMMTVPRQPCRQQGKRYWRMLSQKASLMMADSLAPFQPHEDGWFNRTFSAFGCPIPDTNIFFDAFDAALGDGIGGFY